MCNRAVIRKCPTEKKFATVYPPSPPSTNKQYLAPPLVHLNMDCYFNKDKTVKSKPRVKHFYNFKSKNYNKSTRNKQVTKNQIIFWNLII